MALIYGCRQSKKVDHELNAELGAHCPCPRPGCQGIVQGFRKQEYCHIYFIPLFRYGKQQIVQCQVCGLAYEADSYKAALQKAALQQQHQVQSSPGVPHHGTAN